LRSDLGNEPEELGNISYVYIFSSVALFMLLIACINYMNLTTARSARRGKEIGIRKVTGCSRTQLISQFLIESTLTALIALLISVILILIFLPIFNSLSGKFIAFRILLEPQTLLILIALVILVGLLGGSYPAFYLSKFNPISVLKGSLSKGSSNVNLRNLRRILVIVQFSISMIMLICTWVVSSQLKYLRNIDLGFNKERVLSISANANGDIRSKILAFKNDVRENPQVLSVSTASTVPGGQNIGFNLFSVETKNGFTQKGVWNYAVDEDYFKTLGMQITNGRPFSGLSDTLRSIIINENMVKYYGWGNAIGKKVKYPGDTSGFYFEVVGVVKDFNKQSL
jgi:putative ABC transport system permease protein